VPPAGVTDDETDRIAASERAEARIDEHARQRDAWRVRRARWRVFRAWALALVVLPAAGAAALIAVLESSGGDLAGWSRGAAIAVLAAAFAVPAVLSAAGAWVLGRWAALGLAVCTVLVEVALVFGVGFVALGYGPE
jgi:fatty acid desaturase